MQLLQLLFLILPVRAPNSSNSSSRDFTFGMLATKVLNLEELVSPSNTGDDVPESRLATKDSSTCVQEIETLLLEEAYHTFAIALSASSFRW